YSDQKAGALFARFKQNATWQVPTLTVLRGGAFLDDPNFTNDPRLKYLPSDLKARWEPKNNPVFKNSTAADFAGLKKIFLKQLQIVGAMQRAGVELLAGTDVLNPYCFPGFSLHDELALLVKAGLTPMEALQAATRNPAKFLGQLDSLGTVERGKIADLVLLEANPLAEISNTQKINAVVVGGKLVSKAELQEMLAKVEAVASKK
ncbi:MAG: amidohydrolase family protein, partial [Blastocatellia bacterium]